MKQKSQGIETIARVITLLESIDHRLREHLRVQKNACPVVSIDSDKAYTRTQASCLTSVSKWTIDKARKEGQLVEARRFGKRDVRITGESLLKFIKKMEPSSLRVRKL